MRANRWQVAVTIERAKKLAGQTRLAIQEARRVVIDAEHAITVSRTTRHSLRMFRNRHFLPK